LEKEKIIMNDVKRLALKMHDENRGKLETKSRISLKTKQDMSLAYTPGVAEPCLRIFEDRTLAYKYTNKWNSVAVISDGSAVLGLGNIGAMASMPVMEGKAILFKEFGEIDAYPILLDTQDTDEIVKTVKQIALGFGGINLEDISAPRCFEVEERLKQELDIPVFHDDQHGTAIVVLSGLLNAVKIFGKQLKELKVVVNGAGAAGIAITKILLSVGIKDIVINDSKGIITKDRTDLNKSKKEIAELTNPNNVVGGLKESMVDRDVFIGVSAANLLTKELVQSMNPSPIIFALANPEPEIMPDLAYKCGAAVVATGRSDFPNQVNNVLAFPGVFRGALDSLASDINEEMKFAAAEALASLITEEDLKNKKIIIDPFDSRIKKTVADAVSKAAIDSGVARNYNL
jgi:malate dehydrogenase (oxaloacetate-decarboxylating)